MSQRIALARLHVLHVVARLVDQALEQRPCLLVGERRVLPREQIRQRRERAHVDPGVEPVAIAQLLEQRDVAVRDDLVEPQHLARVARARPGDRQIELAAREALLDELADLILEQTHQLGSADRDLEEAVVDRADFGHEPLAIALQIGRPVTGHASNHPGTSSGLAVSVGSMCGRPCAGLLRRAGAAAVGTGP